MSLRQLNGEKVHKQDYVRQGCMNTQEFASFPPLCLGTRLTQECIGREGMRENESREGIEG